MFSSLFPGHFQQEGGGLALCTVEKHFAREMVDVLAPLPFNFLVLTQDHSKTHWFLLVIILKFMLIPVLCE